MGTFTLENLFLLFTTLQPIFSVISGFASQGLQFIFLFLDLGTFFLGFI